MAIYDYYQNTFKSKFLGGNSDYPDYCKNKNGLTIGTAINKYIYIAYKDNLIRDNYNYKISYFDFERANQIKQLKHPFLKNFSKI